LDPASLVVNRALGILYLLSNRSADAEPYFKTIAQTANTTAATTSLADYYAVVKRFDDAKTVLTGLAKKEDAYAVATIRLAAIDAAQGDRAAALVKVHQVLDKYPKDMPARLMDARLLMSGGKWDEALTRAQSMVKDEPGSPLAADAYLVIGGILTKLDRTDEAIKAYEEVLKRQPRPLGANLSLAALYLAGGSFDKAATYAEQARAIQPANPLA
jgi:tetratricopeptide (TPR) repeat protein